ncbi:MAG: hypothetical protein WC621_02320 [Patescibacteria group bacterium]
MSMEKYEPPPEEINQAEAMMTNKERAMGEQRVKELQKRDFEIALNEVCKRLPELSEKIKTSLETPQLGEHHNEGPRMDSHLSLILATLESMKDGQFHESLKEVSLREAMAGIAVRREGNNPEKTAVNPALIDYTFLHDVAKPDCLTLKIEAEKKGIEITWEQWKDIEKNGLPYQHEGKLITSISYFHSSEGANGQHGNKAAEMLKDKGIPPEIITAISKHEVAYQFGKINAATYEGHFVKPGFSENQQKFILVASYIDTIASLGPDGKPNLSNFANLAKSRDNFLLIKQYTDKGTTFRENELTALKKQDKVLTAEDIEKIIPREEKYNLLTLGEKLDTLISTGQISAEEKEQILSIVSSQPKELGKKFGPKMQLIKPLLEQAKE